MECCPCRREPFKSRHFIGTRKAGSSVSGKRLLPETPPTGGDDADYKVIVVVFTDLPADRAQGVFADVLQQLAVPSYADDGILFGPYYVSNEQAAVHNPRFRPFQSPVPFLFVRPGMIGDWVFFPDNDERLSSGSSTVPDAVSRRAGLSAADDHAGRPVFVNR